MLDTPKQKIFILVESVIVVVLIGTIVFVWLNTPIGGSGVSSTAPIEETQYELMTESENQEISSEEKHTILDSLKNTAQPELSKAEKDRVLAELKDTDSQKEELSEDQKRALLESLRGE